MVPHHRRKKKVFINNWYGKTITDCEPRACCELRAWRMTRSTEANRLWDWSVWLTTYNINQSDRSSHRARQLPADILESQNWLIIKDFRIIFHFFTISITTLSGNQAQKTNKKKAKKTPTSKQVTLGFIVYFLKQTSVFSAKATIFLVKCLGKSRNLGCI
jgi:hypothetical protein